jgi:hypothetical protein
MNAKPVAMTMAVPRPLAELRRAVENILRHTLLATLVLCPFVPAVSMFLTLARAFPQHPALVRTVVPQIDSGVQRCGANADGMQVRLLARQWVQEMPGPITRWQEQNGWQRVELERTGARREKTLHYVLGYTDIRVDNFNQIEGVDTFETKLWSYYVASICLWGR